VGGLLTGREAAEQLGRLGLARESARRALLAGVAGPGQRTRGALLYDADRVQALVERYAAMPPVERLPGDELPGVCRRGTFIAHLPPATDRAATDLGAAAGRRWRISPLTGLVLRTRLERDPPLPLVGVTSTFVVLGAEVVGIERDADGVAFELVGPGEWFETWRDRRFTRGAGGTWHLWSPEWLPGYWTSAAGPEAVVPPDPCTVAALRAPSGPGA
jgi:hypothetical protein